MTSKAGISSPIGSGSHHGSHHGSQHGSEASENDFFGIENSATDSEIMTLIRTFANSYTDSSSLQILNNRITSAINAVHILHERQDDRGRSNK